jgi:hypothetical protein
VPAGGEVRPDDLPDEVPTRLTHRRFHYCHIAKSDLSRQ